MTTMPPALTMPRHVDWRFLLPERDGGPFDHLLLLGGTPDMERALVALNVAKRVSTRARRDDPADAAALLAGSPCTIDEVAPCLGNRAVVYWEIDRREPRQLALTPRRAARQLERHGLDPAAAYWVKPGFPRRDMYLPLNGGGALLWYLDALYQKPTRLRQGIGALLRVAGQHRPFSAVVPCFAVTAVRGIDADPALVQHVRREKLWTGLSGTPMLLAHSANRVVLLLFDAAGSDPKIAIKISRAPAFNDWVEREHVTLHRLGCLVPIQRSVPASRLLHWNGLAANVESGAAGSLLSSRPRSQTGGALDDFSLVTKWLAAFHEQTTTARAPARAWLRQRCDDMRRSYTAMLDPTRDELLLFDRLSSGLDTLNGSTVPIVCAHGDFGPYNVYRATGNLSVIDWESASTGPALVDLIYFVTHWSEHLARCRSVGDRQRLFEALYFPRTRPGVIAQAVRKGIESYMEQLGIAPALWPHLLVYTFVQKAVESAVRSITIEGRDRPGRAHNRYAPYVQTIARRADRLLPETAVA